MFTNLKDPSSTSNDSPCPNAISEFEILVPRLFHYRFVKKKSTWFGLLYFIQKMQIPILNFHIFQILTAAITYIFICIHKSRKWEKEDEIIRRRNRANSLQFSIFSILFSFIYKFHFFHTDTFCYENSNITHICYLLLPSVENK